MHRLELRRRRAEIGEEGGETPIIDFAVDGVGLIDWIRAIAPQLLEATQSASREGRFVGVPESMALEDGSVFFSESHHDYTDAYEGLAPVLVCSDCSIPFCDAIWTRIKCSPDLVTWSGLGLVLEGEFRPLSGIGDFTFDRAGYEGAFDGAKCLAGGGEAR